MPLKFNSKDLNIILEDLGSIIAIFSFIFLIFLVYSFFFEPEQIQAYLFPFLISILLGIALKFAFKSSDEPQLFHAMIISSLAWLFIALLGSYPFYYNGFGFLDSFFESMSGFTTTGMTMIRDLDAIPAGLLLWRSMTQWVGGAGVIMFFMVVLIRTRAALRKFYIAEARSDRITPSVFSTVENIWVIYIQFTLIGILLLYLAGMGPFDAINHSMTSLATGGFSTKNESVAFFQSPTIEAVIIFLMLLGGLSFLIHYKLMNRRYNEVKEIPEVKLFFAIIGISTLIVGLASLFNHVETSPFLAYRNALFQVVSIATTTGFTTIDISWYSSTSDFVFLILMFIGGMAGSTAGGFKTLRVLILVKLTYYEILRATLPQRAVIVIKIGKSSLEDRDILRVVSLLFIYTTITIFSVLFLTIYHNITTLESLSLAISALGNVGPTFLTPEKWFILPSGIKILLIILMWVGRLEVIPVLVLMSSLWRRKKLM